MTTRLLSMIILPNNDDGEMKKQTILLRTISLIVSLFSSICAAYSFQTVTIDLRGKGTLEGPPGEVVHLQNPYTGPMLIRWDNASTVMDENELSQFFLQALGPDHFETLHVTAVRNLVTYFSITIVASDTESLELHCMGTHGMRKIFIDIPKDYLTTQANWVRSRTYTGTGVNDYVHDIVYYDGMGLPEQNIAVSASPSGKSIVTYVHRDSLFRTDSRTYLPHVAVNGNGAIEPVPAAAYRYENLYGADDADYPYQETRFDGFASNRPALEMLPGKVFREDERYTSITYGSNTSGVPYVFRMNLSLDGKSLSVGYPYSNNSLLRETRITADGKRHDSYTDKRGKLLLSRDWTGETTYADTYYIYDANDRLAWVVSPEGSVLLGPAPPLYTDAAFASKWATVYEYDTDNRITGSRRPGCGWEYFVYDKGGRMVLQQDSTLRADNRWMYHIYDNANREINRTIVSSTLSRDSIQDLYNASSFDNTYPALGGCTDWRVPLSTNYFSFVQELETVRYGCDHYRTGTTGLGTGKFSIQLIFYFLPVSGVVSFADLDTTSRGMKIYEKEAILGLAASDVTGGRSYIERVFHYDKKGRVIQTVERNVLGGISRTSVKYDFQGHPLVIHEAHRTSSTDTTDDIKRTEYVYDSRGRVLSETVTLNNGTPATVQYTYDEVGRQTGAVYGNGIEEGKEYTSQGWVKDIAAVDTATSDSLFTQHYHYWDSPSSSPRYDGDIASIDWADGSASHTYAFGYDRMGRLLSAMQPNTLALAETGITYDRNGNLKTLTRYNPIGEIQNELAYTYQGNTLSSLLDNNVQSTYTHDGSGNLSLDGRKGVKVSYNVLNLPDRITLASNDDTEKAVFLYLADGTSVGMFSKVSNYYTGNLSMGSLVYRKTLSTTLQSTDFAAGRIYASTTGTGSDVRYYTRDHLGSTRLITGGDGTVLERSDYYPFGLRMAGGTQATGNRWRFAGKEEQKVGISLDWLNFGARMYDPYLARWTTQDPLAEKYYSISPYSYCSGNPINRMDPNGKDDYEINMKDGKWTVRWNYDPYDRLIAENGNTLIIKDKRIMEGMREGVVPIEGADDTTLHYTVSSADNKELLDVFKFFSDNTDVEWELFVYDDGHAVLATDHLRDVFYNMSYNHYLKYEDPEIAKSQLLSKVHNHNKPYKSERSSMAHDITNSRYLTDINNYVYFGASGNVYIVTGQGIYLTGKIGDLKL